MLITQIITSLFPDKCDFFSYFQGHNYFYSKFLLYSPCLNYRDKVMKRIYTFSIVLFFPSRLVLLRLQGASESPTGLLKWRAGPPTSRVSDLVGLEWGQKNLHFYQFSWCGCDRYTFQNQWSWRWIWGRSTTKSGEVLIVPNLTQFHWSLASLMAVMRNSHKNSVYYYKDEITGIALRCTTWKGSIA